MLNKEAVTELQQILLKEHGQQLSVDETRELGTKLIHLYEILLTPENTYQTHKSINHNAKKHTYRITAK